MCLSSELQTRQTLRLTVQRWIYHNRKLWIEYDKYTMSGVLAVKILLHVEKMWRVSCLQWALFRHTWAKMAADGSNQNWPNAWVLNKKPSEWHENSIADVFVKNTYPPTHPGQLDFKLEGGCFLIIFKHVLQKIHRIIWLLIDFNQI